MAIVVMMIVMIITVVVVVVVIMIVVVAMIVAGSYSSVGVAGESRGIGLVGHKARSLVGVGKGETGHDDVGVFWNELVIRVELSRLFVFDLQLGVAELLLLDNNCFEISCRYVDAVEFDRIVVDGVLEFVVDRHGAFDVRGPVGVGALIGGGGCV